MRLPWGACLLAVVAALLMVLSPVAQADENSYIWALEHADGVTFTGSKLAYLDLGYAICSDLYKGWPTRDVINAAYANPHFDFDYFAAEEVTYIARDYLC